MTGKEIRLLLAEKSSFSQRGIEALGDLGQLDALDLTQSELTNRVGNYDVLVVRLGLRVNAEVLAAGKRLQAVVTPTTGLDHIDSMIARQRGIAVLSLKGERDFLDKVVGTAEHTMALMLSLLRHIPFAFDAVKCNEWRRDLYRGRELCERRLGILGYGRLGSIVARYALVFGMHVYVYDPYISDAPPPIKRCSSLEELLSQAEVLTIHVPLNEETEGLLGARELALLPVEAAIVNTSRGAIINEDALLVALESGRLAGAALDVICHEELVGTGVTNPLLDYARAHTNLVITPHIGGATYESVEKADLFIVGKLRRFLK
jgi:D-3-phosphoglycerate dehydrogenase